MAIFNNNGQQAANAAKARGCIFALILMMCLGGCWFGISYMMNSHSSTTLQRDAAFYTINGQPAIVSGVKHFKVYSVSNKGTYGTDDNFAAAYNLQTGKQIWRQPLKPTSLGGKPAGDPILLGQTDKYLFFYKGELFVLDKQTGQIVKRHEDFAVADKLPTGVAVAEAFNPGYLFNDSLKKVIIKGNDGLFYTIDGETLKTSTIKSPELQKMFDPSAEMEADAHDTYDTFITDVYDDGNKCYALLDEQDTTLLAHDSHGVMTHNRNESERREFYSVQTNNKNDSWHKLDAGVYLFGGLLVDKTQKFIQPVDSVSKNQAFQSLKERYEKGSLYQPIRLPNGGFIILSKATIQNDAKLVITGTSASGTVLWHVNTPFNGVALVHRDGNHLYLFGNAKSDFAEEIRDILSIDLTTGANAVYQVKQEFAIF